MIVKNESENIIPTLNNLWSHIHFDYWVICDTGSTDNTKTLITDFFSKKGVKGELHDDAWQDFGYNRTKALERAYNKTDYLLIFDADDKIEGNFRIPNLTADKYMLTFGTQVKYVRPLLINNRKKWRFVGVLHEYLDCLDPHTTETILGDYHIVSGRTGGDRNKNVNKYYDDAMILMNAYFKETDKKLAARYAFYCAQSFRDTGNHQVDSIEWYKKVLELENWAQEKYFACTQLGILLFSLKRNEEAIFYLLRSIQYDIERIEGISMAMNYYFRTQNFLLVNLLYQKYKNYKREDNKLFLYNDIYHDLDMEYYNSAVAMYTDDKSSGEECCKKIFANYPQSCKYVRETFLNLKHYLPADLELFFKCNQYLETQKNQKDIDPLFDVWYAMFEKVKPLVVTMNSKVVEKIRMNVLLNDERPEIFLSCLFDGSESFKNTINSMLNTWGDIEKVDYWFCVMKEDKAIRKKYKWLKYAEGDMETIVAKMKVLSPKYWIHIENGVFHMRTNYVRPLENAQVRWNRNRAKTIKDYTIKNYMNFNEEYIDSSEMSSQPNFAFSINHVAPILSKINSFSDFMLWDKPTKYVNKICYECH